MTARQRLAGQPVAAGQDVAFFARPGHGTLEFRDRVRVDHGTKGDIALGRVADAQRLCFLEELRDEGLRDVLVYVDARCRTAFLILQTERRARHAFRRCIQIGRLHDDRRILAAELEQARFDPPVGEALVDFQPHVL